MRLQKSSKKLALSLACVSLALCVATPLHAADASPSAVQDRSVQIAHARKKNQLQPPNDAHNASLLCQRVGPTPRVVALPAESCPKGFILLLDLKKFRRNAETRVHVGPNDPAGSQGQAGDLYFNSSERVMFGPKTELGWGAGRSLVGAPGERGEVGVQGEKGDPGERGPQGATGATGEVGAIGETGATGAQGVQGIQGTQGVAGPSGADGRTILNGSSDPSPTVGATGDFYINTSTNMLFGPKNGGEWPSGVAVVGPTGAQGETGATGPQGPQGVEGASGVDGPQGQQGVQGPVGPIGAQGARGESGPQGATGAQGIQGVAGADGRSIRYGSTDPAATDGVDGDFYINTTSHTIFGPKSSGEWPLGTSIVGPTGAVGAPGATGAEGSQGQTGPQGATGPQGQQGNPGSSELHYLGTTGTSLLNLSPLAIPAFGSGGGQALSLLPQVEMPISKNCSAGSLYVSLTAAPGVVVTAQSRQFVLVRNGTDTVLTCTVSGAATSCSDSIHTVSLSAGDLIAIKMVPSAAAGSAAARFFWICS